MRLVLLEAPDSGLQEGGHGAMGQVGGELGAHPQAAAQQEGRHRAVQVRQHHARQKVANVKVDISCLKDDKKFISP